MAHSLAVKVDSTEAEYGEIIGWYRDELERSYPPTDLVYEPIAVGPTWRYDNGWVLPEFTLGWRVLAWCGVWLRDKHGNPWQFTPEQTRFLLWFYAVDPDTEGFAYHSAVLQRCKGWGKDPIAACMSVSALFADVTFDGWHGDVPLGREEPSAWVQVAAVSQVQTQNTMKLFPSLISPEARKHYGIQVGKLNVWGLGDTRQIEAVTSSPLAIEGGRPTLIVRNETQNWNSSNGGHDMAGAIEGNAAKSEGGAARILDICNAYRPNEDSVAERVREGWEKTLGGPAAEQIDFGLLYDSLEAPGHAPLTAADAPVVVESVRGDAVWLSTRRIVKSILNPANTPSESRRKWYNQVVAVADARFDPGKVKAAEVGEQLTPGDEVVLFGDGSKSDDATGLVAVRLSDMLAQVLHLQQPLKGQIVDRERLSEDVDSAFATYKVHAFWFDPSHAKDNDATGDDRFWWPLCDEWATKYGRALKFWAVKTGDRKHAVAWDMSTPSHQAQFTAAVEQLDTDLGNDAVRYATSGQLKRHLLNAVDNPGRWGMSMQKNHRESAKKIDLAVCLAGGRMLARLVQLSKIGSNSGVPGKGRVVGLA